MLARRVQRVETRPMPASSATFSCHGTVLSAMRAHILLADDDLEMRQLLALVLRGDGYDVQEVADGRELVERLARSLDAGSPEPSYDLLIADLRMPGYGGLDVLSALSCLGSGLPVIMMTAFGDQRTRRTAAALGAIATFDKPFDLNDLRTAVLHALSESSRPRGREPAPAEPP